MHRGYWARVHLVKKLVQKFITTSKGIILVIKQEIGIPVQVISLGCGLETLWFNLIKNEKYQNQNFKFIDLDLLSVVNKKIKKI